LFQAFKTRGTFSTQLIFGVSQKTIVLLYFPAVDMSQLIPPAFSPSPRTSELLGNHKLETQQLVSKKVSKASESQ